MGSVVGSVAGVALIGLVFLLFMNHHKKKKRDSIVGGTGGQGPINDMGEIDTFGGYMQPSSSVPSISDHHAAALAAAQETGAPRSNGIHQTGGFWSKLWPGSGSAPGAAAAGAAGGGFFAKRFNKRSDGNQLDYEDRLEAGDLPEMSETQHTADAAAANPRSFYRPPRRTANPREPIAPVAAYGGMSTTPSVSTSYRGSQSSPTQASNVFSDPRFENPPMSISETMSSSYGPSVGIGSGEPEASTGLLSDDANASAYGVTTPLPPPQAVTTGFAGATHDELYTRMPVRGGGSATATSSAAPIPRGSVAFGTSSRQGPSGGDDLLTGTPRTEHSSGRFSDVVDSDADSTGSGGGTKRYSQPLQQYPHAQHTQLPREAEELGPGEQGRTTGHQRHVSITSSEDDEDEYHGYGRHPKSQSFFTEHL